MRPPCAPVIDVVDDKKSGVVGVGGEGEEVAFVDGDLRLCLDGGCDRLARATPEPESVRETVEVAAEVDHRGDEDQVVGGQPSEAECEHRGESAQGVRDHGVSRAVYGGDRIECLPELEAVAAAGT